MAYKIFAEYGEGCGVSILGDVYSLGILLLEMFTGRSPTDDVFTGQTSRLGRSRAGLRKGIVIERA